MRLATVRSNALRRVVVWVAALGCGLALVAAKPKDKLLDLVWTNPDVARFQVREVALLPAVSYDRDAGKQNMVERFWGQQFSRSGHRWLSPTFCKERLRAAAGGGDSLLKLVSAQVLRDGRVDSTAAPEIARALHTRALLSVRVQSWEKIEIEPNQSGRASTTIWLQAALVDSSGALLWTASGSQRLEGVQYDPDQAMMGVKPGELGTRPITGSATAAPAPEEVLTKLLGRWVPLFPAAAADTTASGG